MLPARVQLQLIAAFPRRITEGEALDITIRDASAVGSLFPWWIQYKLYIVDGHGRTAWVQSDIFDLDEYSRIEFFLPDEFMRSMVFQQDRRFRLGVIALDARYGSRPIASSAALSPVMWLRSLEEAAAEQAAEQNPASIAQQQSGSVASSEQSSVQPLSSRSTDRVGKTDNDEDGDSLSDDSSSEQPAVEANKSGLPFPRTFDEYRKYWGTRLKDIAAQFGVPESGLSKGWKRACSRHLNRKTKLPRWPATEERIRELEKLVG